MHQCDHLQHNGNSKGESSKSIQLSAYAVYRIHNLWEMDGNRINRKNKKQFYISGGFAHDFLVLSDFAELSYKCTGYYRPEDDKGIAWNNSIIGIERSLVVGTYRGTASPEGYFMEDGTAIQLRIRDKIGDY